MPPAARLSDQTTHGTPLAPGPGSVNTLIGSLPAWRTMIDQHACPAVSISGADGVGSVLMGSPTVLINNQMACRVMDIVVEKPGLAMGPVNPIAMGCMTVMIGEAGMGGAGSAFGGAMAAAKQNALPVVPTTPQVVASAATGGSSSAFGKSMSGAKSQALPTVAIPPSTPSPAIEARKLTNAALRATPQFAADIKSVGVSEQQVQQMFAKELPLGFKNNQQFADFKKDLAEALDRAGLKDAEVGLKGTATTFYSENPSKPLGHHWDADPSNPGDYDLNLTSAKMVEQLRADGLAPSPKYGVFRTRDIEARFPDLDRFAQKWSKELGRDVNLVGYPVPQPRDATEYLLKRLP